ncbi:MAG: class I SAM-dependent methyltransferase [Nitrosomonas sp.]|uniref:class I SAM-dependent methyltransferase n=1 Tax=Nitrosomonas sp. TaxID=42353 RepID=UPI0025FFA121|nr:class I SAM-dependent methyltransferase [Nitrosomonas sp.]UJP03505.1 MAG: class I SAM-dependent methyltransferase [Nitrosomonas sp.]
MFVESLKNWLKSFFSGSAETVVPIEASFSPLVYRLESPKYQLFDLHGENWVSGWVFYWGDKVVSELAVTADKTFVGNFSVNLPRPDVGAYVPFVPAAKTCGFNFKLPAPSSTLKKIQIDVVFSDQTRTDFLIYDVDEVRLQAAKFAEYQKKLQQIPVPDGALVFLTQGHSQTEEYQNGIIPAVLTMQSYLQKSGVDIEQIKTLLDFGCGSGRLLVGWHMITPLIRLYGCDLNPQLIQWAQQHLPQPIDCQLSHLNPPLPYQDHQFDFIYLISVFTHLSLETQKQWIQEFKRILRKGGYLMVTLHGELYVRNSFDQQHVHFLAFDRTGYAEEGQASVEGENFYRAFHRFDFVTELFAGFAIKGYFPNGNDKHRNTLFQVAQSQDVYVMQYLGE